MTARATGPFGELSRKARLDSEKYPVEYLQHLVEIGVAEVTIAHRIEPQIEVKAEKKPLESAPQLSVSRPAPRSRKKTAKRSEKAG